MANAATLLSCHRGRWNVIKLCLRCISFVLSILIIGLSVNEGIRKRSWYESHPGGSPFGYAWWFCLPITLLSISLDGYELTSTVIRKRSPGIHPGWHVGVEIVLLGGNIVALIFISSQFSEFANWDVYVYGQSYFPPISLRPLKIAIVAVVGVFTLIRFILFIFACVDTERYLTTARVELIVQVLRQQNINGDPAAAPIINNSIHPQVTQHRNQAYYDKPTSLEGPPHTIWSPTQLSSEPAFYPELPENTKFLAAQMPRLPRRRYSR
ncbi:hypothetical protein HD806DRAFT_383224 [Xylariaceae sp. AK1471]|nr:hypothetical protein HD806DRAFT_383224 [Xylariaceae sp. AK1471]